jgi:hypothetical protein
MPPTKCRDPSVQANRRRGNALLFGHETPDNTELGFEQTNAPPESNSRRREATIQALAGSWNTDGNQRWQPAATGALKRSPKRRPHSRSATPRNQPQPYRGALGAGGRQFESARPDSQKPSRRAESRRLPRLQSAADAKRAPRSAPRKPFVYPNDAPSRPYGTSASGVTRCSTEIRSTSRPNLCRASSSRVPLRSMSNCFAKSRAR